jgi:hypothetical protein
MANRLLINVDVLRERGEFRRLFVAQLVGMLGTQLAMVAIPFQVYAQTHSSLAVGTVSWSNSYPW